MDSQVSFSPAIQGLLVHLNPEYELTNDAISFVNDLSQTVLTKVTKEASRFIQYSQSSNKQITSIEIQAALRTLFPAELARQAISEAATALNEYQAQLKEDSMRDAIMEFEVLEGNDKKDTAEVSRSGRSRNFIWFSPDLILKFLSSQNMDESKIDKTGTIFLSSSLEYFVTRLLDVVGHKSSPTLTKPAFQSVFEEGEIFHGLWNNLYPKPVPVAEETATDKPASDAPTDTDAGSPSLPALAALSPRRLSANTISRIPSLSSLSRNSSSSSFPPSPGSQSSEYLLPEPRLDVRTFVAPLIVLLGQACSGFEVTSRGMQIMASVTEYLLRFVVVESARVARYKPPHEVSSLQVQVAVRRALPSDLARDAVAYASTCGESAFQGRALLLVHTAAELVHPLWSVSFEQDADSYIANILVYVVKQALSVAATHARSVGRWIINSFDVLQALEAVITVSAPVWKAVTAAKERSLSSFVSEPLTSEEGPILAPPSHPRISAAEKIYFTSIICETPLQTDNQILIMFLFLASLSLRAIIVA